MAVNVGCDGKVKYCTYLEAEKKVRAMKRSRHTDQHNQSLGLYRCKLCQYYHIGNSSPKMTRKNKHDVVRYKYEKEQN